VLRRPVESTLSLPAENYVWGVPLTLGHEGAGIVDKLGEGVNGLAVGDAVAVYGPWGCGRCYPCSQGAENYCENAAAEGIVPPGLGAPGAMAEYMIVDNARHLVPLGDLDPVQNVSLTDAGLTPYHAIKLALPKLVPGTTAVVIGAGGLGAHAVIDFVGIQPTIELGRAMIRVAGSQVLVGVGAGTTAVGVLAGPYESSITAPYWGTRSELFEVLELARSGAIHVETEVFSLDDGVEAYHRLHAGTLRGRAVIVP